MEHYVYGSLLVLGALITALIWARYRGRLLVVARERDEIAVGEHRMFEFLHGLGESLRDDTSASALQRFIVEGAADVVSADGAILYLAEDGELTAVHVSATEPVVIPLPESLRKETPGKSAALRSHLLLAHIPESEGLLGEILGGAGAAMIHDLAIQESLKEVAAESQHNTSAMLAPLIYGQKRFGVLAMTRHRGGKGSKGFSMNEFEVFRSVAEQSSFALGNALVHVEAGEKRRLDEEIRRASEIQRIMLPMKPPALSDFHLAAIYRPARVVSGDYYDYIKIDETHYGVAIGDVCGKGIAASLVMAMSRSILRANVGLTRSPAQVLHAVNRVLFPDMRQDMFVSLLYLVIEKGNDEITLACAGHEPPLCFRSDTSEIEALEPSGLVAGIDQGEVFEQCVEDFCFRMAPGDVILLFTDGAIERQNVDMEEFGIDRLRERFQELASKGSEAVIDGIAASLRAFGTGMPQNDDVTLIALEKR